MHSIINLLDTEIDPIINKVISKVAYVLTGKENKFFDMEREIIADRLLSIVDKKYLIRAFKDENTLYHKYTGLPMMDKSTPPAVKAKLKEILDLILDKDELGLNEEIKKFRDIFPSLDIKDIAVNKSVNSLDYKLFPDGKMKHITSGAPCPFNSRCAINFNKLVDKGLIDAPKIRRGDKILTLYIKMPNNLTGDNALGTVEAKYIDKLPNIKDFIDYDTLFDKNFLQKVHLMTCVYNYNYKEAIKPKLSEWL